MFGNNNSNENKEEKAKQVSSKPVNKDFLFTDGYTMENVTQAAQDYLTTSGHAGECTGKLFKNLSTECCFLVLFILLAVDDKFES